MIRINILILVAIIIASFFSKAYAQETINYKLGDYLVKIKEIDSAIYRVETKSKKQEIIANYYINKLSSIHSNGKRFVFFKFGSYTEHLRPHFALIINDDFANICFIDCVDVEEGIKKLLSCLKFNEAKSKELEAFKVEVIKNYINGFPARSTK